MQPPAGVAQPFDQQPLDKTVDVLVAAVDERRIRPPLLEQRGERLFNLARLVRREHGRLRERARPREAAGHIVFEQPAIEPERRAEFERGGIRLGIKPTRPQIRHQWAFVNAMLLTAGAADSWQSTTVHSPLNSFRRTTPPTCCCMASVEATSAAR